MATRTFCDRCNTECVNSVTKVYVEVIHKISSGEHAGNDEYKPSELCFVCGQEVISLAYPDPDKYRMSKEYIPEDMPERAVMAEERPFR